MAGLSLANKPELAEQVAVMRAAGKSQAVIADTLGIAQSTVSDSLRTPALRERLEIAHKALSNACLDAAVDNWAHLVQNYRTLEGDEKQHGFKASQAVLESVGILASRTPSQLVVNILNANQVVLSPVVAGVVQAFSQQLVSPADDDDEVIDVEPQP